MSHTIIWLDAVTSEITHFYQQAVSETGAEVAALNRSLTRIVALLEQDPANCGESRHGQIRVLVELPLSIDFKFIPEQRLAIVVKARYCPGTGSRP